jgi:hypothetical protein
MFLWWQSLRHTSLDTVSVSSFYADLSELALTGHIWTSDVNGLDMDQYGLTST